MTEHDADDHARFVAKASADSHFSWIRTRLSIERTLMSWVRTGTALIGFGFTIVQFFQRFGEMEGVAAATRPQMPRYLGLAMIAAGIIALAISVWQYRVIVSYLWSPNFRILAGLREGGMQSPAIAVAIIVMLIGLFAFAAVFMRTV